MPEQLSGADSDPTPAISVVVPTRNRLPLLEDAIASVQAQTLPDWEIVVVDDCSEDGTWDWLEHLRDPRVRAIRLDRHSERSAARNKGLAMARGQFVLFLDDDDILTPIALEKLAGALRQQPLAAASIGAKVHFDDRGHRRRAPHVRVKTTRTVWSEVLLGWIAVPGQCLFSVKELRSIGGWDGRFVPSEDQELWLRLGERAVVLVPDSVLGLREHGGQWRPTNAVELEHNLRAQVARPLTGEERRAVDRVLRARSESEKARNDFAAERYTAALAAQMRTIVFARSLILSPLVGPTLVQGLLRAAAGLVLRRQGVHMVKRLKCVLRSIRRSDPGAHREVRVIARVPER